MSEVDERELRKAVEHNFNATARFVEVVRVVEHFEGAVVWDGFVSVFNLEGNPLGTRAYAWSHAIDGKTARRFVTVMHLGVIDSPLAAVRAALVSEQRKER